MAVFFTSDTHFGHNKLAEYRGFTDVHAMNKAMTDAWNAKVTPGDIVYHLGDVSFQRWDAAVWTIAGLRGQIHLVAGNHDKQHRKKEEFRKLFVKVVDYHEVKIDSSLLESGKIVLSHYAFAVWNKSHYGSIHLHGHSHGSLPSVGRRMDVGVDTRPDFAPWSLEEVLERMKDVPVHKADHH